MFIIQSALQTLKKYADFKGRASRRGARTHRCDCGLIR